MIAVEVKAKIVVDDTGIESEMPVLVTSEGILHPLLDYLLSHESNRSPSWQAVVMRSARMLIEYIAVNEHCFNDPKLLFSTFATRLYTGTIGDDGFDPSGLYWSPLSTSAANRVISALTGLTDYLARNHGGVQMNPLHVASRHEERLLFAAWFRKNQNDFLGHIDKSGGSGVGKLARDVRGRHQLSRVDDDAIAFPERLFESFYFDGFGTARDRRCVVRDQLILLILHAAGARESEPLHLWVSDVFNDPLDPERALVRVYHPQDGRAPDEWRSRSGKTNRSAYLREVHGLTSRNKLYGGKRVGWKGRLVDHPDHYILLHWFPSAFGVVFKKLWREHLLYLCSVERHHPYAFVSYEKSHVGEPYSLAAFNENYASALARIGLSMAKVEGLSPHGHRHAYGRRLTRAGVDPLIRKKALHHSSLHSQAVYTSLSACEVSAQLDSASMKLAGNTEIAGPASDEVPFEINLKSDRWKKILESGFEDVDPFGLLSGRSPKIR